MTKTRPKKKATTAKRISKIGHEPKVIARATILGGGPASVVVRFRARTGQIKKLRLSRGDLHDRSSLMKRLADEDCLKVPFDSDGQKSLQEDLADAEPENIVEYSLATGWVRNRFVLPDAIIGQLKADNPKIAYEAPEGPVLAKYTTAGTLSEWQENVAKLAGHSATMTFAICLALAAALLEVCGIEGGGVHLTGKSSKGKSSTARVARSVCGPPELKSWSATINGIEAACCAFNGTLMCIDETGELEGTDDKQAQLIRQTAFKIASGVGKLRAGKAWNTDQKWRLFVLSSGEVSLEVIAAQSGGKRLAGEQIRFPNLPCVIGKYGVFETLPAGYSDSVPLANDLNDACLQYHGTAFRAFLGKLTQEPDRAKSEIKLLMQQFYDYLPLGEANGWERRFAQKFALAATAGVLGVRWKVLPWTEEHVLKAVKRCYRRSRKAIPEAEEIIKRGIVALEGFVTDPAKVIDLRKLTTPQRQSLNGNPGKGYVRHRREYGLHLVVTLKNFRGWFREPRDADLVLHELDRQGRIKRDTKRNILTRQVKLWPGHEGKLRYLVITIPEQ